MHCNNNIIFNSCPAKAMQYTYTGNIIMVDFMGFSHMTMGRNVTYY